ncbi:hypothetical protein ACFL1E_01220 [Candidatus Omnitrophota bacterium]
MDPSMPSTLPPSFIIIAGLIQFALFVWLFIFPVLIIRKLNEIADAVKAKSEL